MSLILLSKGGGGYYFNYGARYFVGGTIDAGDYGSLGGWFVEFG